jgi:uncharacterized protein (DUF1697 family)
MAVFVCLIRAIGPVTHAKMSMAALRERCEAEGLGAVGTVGNTGNLLCRSTRSPHAVRRLVQSVVDGFELGAMCEVFVRTPTQMRFVVDANPFPEAATDHPAAVGVCVFHTSPRWPVSIRNYDGPHRLATVGAHLVIDYGDAQNAGPIDIEKRVRARMTQRNWRVFAKLADRASRLEQQS